MSVRDRLEALSERDARLIEEARETIRRSYELLAYSRSKIAVLPERPAPPDDQMTDTLPEAPNQAAK